MWYDKLIILLKPYSELIIEITRIFVIWLLVELILPSYELIFFYGRAWVLYSLGEAIYDEYKRRRK